jgi:hypothetical protein
MGKGKIKSGDTVVLAAFGSGFTWEALSLNGNLFHLIEICFSHTTRSHLVFGFFRFSESIAIVYLHQTLLTNRK